MTKSDIFWKSWWWSAVAGSGAAMVFLLISSLPFMVEPFRHIPFVDTLVVWSIIGCYFGAGYVGSRIATKYYDAQGRFARRYIRFSVMSFVVVAAVAFSPLSFLMILWSFIAPACVLLTLRGMVPKQVKHAAHARPRVRRRPVAQ